MSKIIERYQRKAKELDVSNKSAGFLHEDKQVITCFDHMKQAYTMT